MHFLASCALYFYGLFDAIEKKDSTLMNSAILGDAQVWSRRNNEEHPSINFSVTLVLVCSQNIHFTIL